MHTALFIAIVAGLGGMLGWGFADFFAKKTIDRIGDVQTLAWAGVFGTVTFFIAMLYQVVVRDGHFAVPHDAVTWALLAFFGVLQTAVYLFAYKGFGKGQVALLNPLFASFAGIVALISILFLAEPTTPLRIAALAVIFLGVVLLSLDLQALRSRRVRFTAIPGFREVLIATLLAAVWTVLWSLFVSGKDWLAYSLYMFVFMTLAVFAASWYRRLPMRVDSRGTWLFVALIGVCETVAYISITLGYGATSLTSVVAVLSGGFSLPTILLAYIFLKERINPLQLAGCLVIIAGVMLLPLV
jgi:drug/metabolite transporter (DMT)-like permease